MYIKLLGKGSYSKVKLVKKDGINYAMKIIDKKVLKNKKIFKQFLHRLRGFAEHRVRRLRGFASGPILSGNPAGRAAKAETKGDSLWNTP